MKNKIVLTMVALAGVFSTQAQTSAGIQWERTFGGSEKDFASQVKPTSDGGYVLGGYSYSGPSGTKTSAAYGLGDYWVVKLDASGNKQWDRSFGGTNFDGIHALEQTADGGYVLGGISFSDASGNKASAHYGSGDYWIVKLDAGGNRLWDNSFGGSSNEVLRSLQQTSDGGFILGGISFSGISGNKTSASQGAGDFWVVKLDGNGNKQWEKSYGGNDRDELRDLTQTSDGGYVLGGSSRSGVSGNKTSANQGTNTSDYWLLKLDGNGNKQWEKVYGGNDADELYSVQQVSDSGYILGGSSYSAASGNKTSGTYGSHDYWVVKLNSSGTKQWEKSYGGDNADELHSVQQASDGGYRLGGISASGISGTKTSACSNSDSGDYWVVKLDGSGNKQSEQCIRGSYSAEVLRLQPTPDGGSIVTGLSTALLSATPDYTAAKLAPPLAFNAFSLAAKTNFQMQLPALSGTNYILQATTNWIQWTPLRTNRAVNGAVTFVETNAIRLPRRFYRVQQQ
jgi:hypothetical protein